MPLIRRYTENHGRVVHIPGLFYRFDSTQYHAGHIRLFGKPLRGFSIFTYNQLNETWSKSRVWWFGLFSVIHVDAGRNNELKHTKPPGWHISFAKLRLKKVYRGYQLTFELANKGYGY